MISDRLGNIVLAITTVVWTTGQLVSIFNLTDFEPSEVFNGAFIGIVGGALVAKQRASSGGEHKK